MPGVIREIGQDGVRLDNGIIGWESTPDERGVWRQRLTVHGPDGALTAFESQTTLTAVAAGETVHLPWERMQVLETGGDEGTAVRFQGQQDGWRYALTLHLDSGARWLEGEVMFETETPCRGWFYYGIGTSSDTQCWIYPWLNAGRDMTPTLGGHSLGMDCPGHIHADLAGVPLIITRREDVVGGLGFALSHNYHHDSLGFERQSGQQVLAVGKGQNSGRGAFHGRAQYRPGVTYRFSFQLFALSGGFGELARTWAEANDFCFDRKRYYTIDQALEIVVDGRSQKVCNGCDRYISEDVDGMPVRGYAHGSNQDRIAVLRQSYNAYVDYLLYRRTGREIFRQRAFEQMDFLLAAQTDAGWFQEDWQIGSREWSYEAVGEDGGVVTIIDRDGSIEARSVRTSDKAALILGAAVPESERTLDTSTGKNVRGPRPDYLGMTCHYVYKMARILEEEEGIVRQDWMEALGRCLDWLLSVQREDGGWAMTVSTDGTLQTDAAPAGRLLVALDRLASALGDERLESARKRQERWVLAHCVAPQRWWGSHKDTGLMIDYGGLHNFVQYCVQRYERTGEERYLAYALECTYFNFFEHCPKQLEWLWHYSKGGIMEQGNYMQYDIDNMDNLPCFSWYKLAARTGDAFVRAFLDQQVYTMMHTLCDDPEHPWYGAWPQYLVDSADAVGHYDESPVDKGASKYAGSIVCSVVEDLLLVQEEGYEVPRRRSALGDKR